MMFRSLMVRDQLAKYNGKPYCKVTTFATDLRLSHNIIEEQVMSLLF